MFVYLCNNCWSYNYAVVRITIFIQGLQQAQDICDSRVGFIKRILYQVLRGNDAFAESAAKNNIAYRKGDFLACLVSETPSTQIFQPLATSP